MYLHGRSTPMGAQSCPAIPFGAGYIRPTAYTPRQYVKILAFAFQKLLGHQEVLSDEFLGTLQGMGSVLQHAALPYSPAAAATGRLHHYLLEDQHVQQLQDAGTAVLGHMREAAAAAPAVAAAAAAAAASAAQLSPQQALYAAELEADLTCLSQQLAAARCMLPAGQLQLIHAFRELCRGLDPLLDIPEDIQAAAEQLVQEVIQQVYGPFFNGETLQQEVDHLVRTAAGIDPSTQQLQAATVKLLASALLSLDGEASEGGREATDLAAPDAAASDPFCFSPPAVLDNAAGLRVAGCSTAGGAAAGTAGGTVGGTAGCKLGDWASPQAAVMLSRSAGCPAVTAAGVGLTPPQASPPPPAAAAAARAATGQNISGGSSGSSRRTCNRASQYSTIRMSASDGAPNDCTNAQQASRSCSGTALTPAQATADSTAAAAAAAVAALGGGRGPSTSAVTPQAAGAAGAARVSGAAGAALGLGVARAAGAAGAASAVGAADQASTAGAVVPGSAAAATRRLPKSLSGLQELGPESNSCKLLQAEMGSKLPPRCPPQRPRQKQQGQVGQRVPSKVQPCLHDSMHLWQQQQQQQQQELRWRQEQQQQEEEQQQWQEQQQERLQQEQQWQEQQQQQCQELLQQEQQAHLWQHQQQVQVQVQEQQPRQSHWNRVQPHLMQQTAGQQLVQLHSWPPATQLQQWPPSTQLQQWVPSTQQPRNALCIQLWRQQRAEQQQQQQMSSQDLSNSQAPAVGCYSGSHDKGLQVAAAAAAGVYLQQAAGTSTDKQQQQQHQQSRETVMQLHKQLQRLLLRQLMLQAPQLLLPGNSVAESADCPWGDDPTSLGSEGGNTVTQTDLQQQLVDLQLQQHQQQQVLPAHMQAMAAAFTGLTSAGSSSSNAGLLQELLSGMPGDAAAAAAASIMQSCGGSCSVEAELQLHQGGLERLACFIEANARVTGLSLAHNALGPWGAQRLCEALQVHCSVQCLHLPHNSLGDAGAVAVARLLESGCRLTSLQLSSNDITDAGVLRLAEAIRTSGHLQRLSVHNNSVGRVGCQALVAAVKACRRLKVVEFLPGNCAAPEDIQQLVQAVKRNRRLRLIGLWRAPCGCLQP